MKHSISESPTSTIALEASSSWQEFSFPTVKSTEDLLERIDYILERMKAEDWLPYELTKQITKLCMHVKFEHFAGRLTPSHAKTRVEELATACFEYDELTLTSSTLCQIRTLDLELNDRLAADWMNLVAI